MTKNLRKILAGLLALVMLVSVSGISVLAAEVAEIPMGEEARGESPAAGPRSTTKQTLAQLMAGEDEADCVAKIGDTEYTTLQEAITAADVGDTVTLLRDITDTVTVDTGCDITLDLNGKTIYGMIWNWGELTITGDGTVDNTGDAYGYSAVYSGKSGDAPSALTIESGTFKSGDLDTMSSGTATIENYQVDGVNIQGGTFINNSLQDPALSLYGCKTDATVSGGTYTTSGNQNAIGVTGGSVVTISGITAQGGGMGLAVNGGSDVTIDSGNFSGDYALKVSGASTVTVNGGAFAGTGEGDDIYAVYATGEATVTLNGGTFSSEGAYILLPGAFNSREGTNVTITGGTFTAGELATDSVKEYEPQTLHISGGTFLSDVSDYREEGYEIKTNEDGTYTVVAINGEETDYAASVSANGETTYYNTLQDAIDAAAELDDGEETPVVNLLRDVAENVTVGVNLYTDEPIERQPAKLVLNLNGHTMDGDQKDSVLVVYPDTTLTLNGDGGKIVNGKVEGRAPGHANIWHGVAGSSAAAGGGVCIFTRCDVTINDVEISGNEGWAGAKGWWWDGHGAGVAILGHLGDRNPDYTDRSALALNRVTITNNQCPWYVEDQGNVSGGGAGLYVEHADATVTDSFITGNKAFGGGGIKLASGTNAMQENMAEDDFTSGATLTLVNTQVTGNETWQDIRNGEGGGGIFCDGRTTLNVTQGSVVSGNKALHPHWGAGGGILAHGDALDPYDESVIIDGKQVQTGRFIKDDARDRAVINISDSFVCDNEAFGSGGGIFAEANVLIMVTNSEICDNTAGYGGGICVYGGHSPHQIGQDEYGDPKYEIFDYDTVDLQISDSKINGNTTVYCEDVTSGNGAGLFCDERTTATVTDSEICGNMSDNVGGGVFVYKTTVTVKNGSIQGNESYCGGGIGLRGAGKVDVQDTTIAKNNAIYYGGGVYGEAGTEVTLDQSEILENEAGYYGGGIYTSDGKANVQGTTIAENNAIYYGGGIYASGGEVALNNSSVQKCHVTTYYGGGIYAGSAEVSVNQTAIVNNTSDYGVDDIYANKTATVTFSTPDYFGEGTLLESDNRPISGWYVDKTGASRWTQGYYVKADLEAKPLYLKAAHGPYCDITYDLDGGTLGTDEDGSELTNPTEYEPGFSEFTLNNPTKEGYTFLGWTGSNGEEPEETVSITKETTGDLSYTANWKINEYNVIYKVDDVVIEDLGLKVVYGAVVTVAEKYVKPGYTATDWATEDATVTDGAFTMPAKDVTLTASASANSYTTTYDLAGGTTTSEATTFTQHYGDATATIAEPTRAGYTFQGWDPTVAETVTGDATYTAQWKAIDYTVTYVFDGETYGDVETYQYGAEVTVKGLPTKEGYTVGAWATGDATITDGKFSMPAGNVTLTATSAAIEYTITYKLDDGALAEGESNPATYTVESETFTLKNPTKAGHTFLGWLVNDGDEPQTEVSVVKGTMGDLIFTAQWKKNSSGGGTSRPSRPSNEEELEDPDVPLADLPVIVPTLNSKDHVAYLIGRPDGSIAPLENITRGEVATIFFRLLTEENRTANWSTSCSYTDMDGTEYFYNPVSTATKAGLVEGYLDGTFGGGKRITRAEMATIAARFLSESYTGEDLFDDIGDHWAQEYINRAANAGWFRTVNADGTKVGNFRPNDYITRAEVVVMVNRMLGRKASMDYLLPNMKVWPDNVYSETSAWYYLDIQEATNSHDYTREGDGLDEKWTGLNANPDWAALERR